MSESECHEYFTANSGPRSHTVTLGVLFLSAAPGRFVPLGGSGDGGRRLGGAADLPGCLQLDRLRRMVRAPFRCCSRSCFVAHFLDQTRVPDWDPDGPCFLPLLFSLLLCCPFLGSDTESRWSDWDFLGSWGLAGCRCCATRFWRCGRAAMRLSTALSSGRCSSLKQPPSWR